MTNTTDLDDFFAVPVRVPTWEKPCEAGCGGTVARYPREGDVVCGTCDAVYNAGGQRLRDDAPTFFVHGYEGPTPWDDDDY